MLEQLSDPCGVVREGATTVLTEVSKLCDAVRDEVVGVIKEGLCVIKKSYSSKKHDGGRGRYGYDDDSGVKNNGRGGVKNDDGKNTDDSGGVTSHNKNASGVTNKADENGEERMMVSLDAWKMESKEGKVSVVSIMQHSQQKCAQVWEKAEACVMLMKKLSAIKSPELTKKLEGLIPVLAESLYVRGYECREDYIEGVLRLIPELFQNLNKTTIKRSIELFLDVFIEFYPPITSSSSSSFTPPSSSPSTLTNAKPIEKEAFKCIETIASLVGKEVFDAKLKNYDLIFYQKFFKRS